jgi:hypothetical protein
VLTKPPTVQRNNPTGANAPATGCDASHAGQELRIPYSAVYVFYAPK